MTAPGEGAGARAGRWALAAAVSVLAHAALVLLILVATEPEEVAYEPTGPARLSMTPEEVRTERAEPAEPDAERAEAEGPPADALATAAIRSDRAAPVAAAAERAPAVAPPPPVAAAGAVGQAAPPVSHGGARLSGAEVAAPALAADAARGEPVLALAARPEAAAPAALPEAGRLTAAPAPAPALAGAVLPAAERVAAGAAPASALAPASAPVATLASAPASPEALAEVAAAGPPLLQIAAPAQTAAPAAAQPAAPAVTRPRGAVLDAAPAGSGPALAPTSAPAAAVAGTAPQGRRAPALAGRGPAAEDLPAARLASLAPATRTDALAAPLRAALAWAGAEQVSFDAQSLATVAAFMAPRRARDSSLHGGDARDGLAALLASYPCSRLEAAFVPESGALEIRGHVPEPGMRGVIETRVREAIGGAIGVGNDLLVLPEPQCNLLGAVAALGLPQSTDQADDPLVVGQAAQASIFAFAGGERLQVALGAADYDAYVYLDYFDAEGNVLHLVPSEHVPLRRHDAKTALVLGDEPGDFGGFEPIVGPPYGRDIAVALAASEPLYDGVRPLVEPAGRYLEWLRGRVAEKRADPGFRGEWVYFFIDTRAP